ncbi:hypothetical protein CAC42_7690 [Sphaceloma murrayae]|uniref:Uncharacterized protein n=1 Tax=Sphaceloma murrayae TaxID=2082308 RepID=A0A2K1QXT7_9PEZI|nr:hypothetical protein CAC42_7690 [Sphaceloma murrayae]
MNPLISWAVALSAIGGAAVYYSQTGKKPQQSRARSGTGSSETKAQPKTVKKEPKTKRKTDAPELSGSDVPLTSGREKPDNSAAEGAKKRKGGKDKLPAQVEPTVAVKIQEPEQDDGADKAWAEQMANVRKGTNLSVPSKDASRTKTVKTSTLETNAGFSSAASSTGAEADDDMSPAISPSLRAGDVSDMLEPTAPGPSVLRLTEPTNPAPQRASRPQKEFQAAETKKQRQNKKKNEERKAFQEEQERQRQALLESQRRTAREARGEPARNGLQQARAPASVWTGSNAASSPAPAVQPLLDTFDRAAPPAIGNAQASIMPTNGGAEKGLSNGMSEQDAIRAATKASEDEAGWATVGTKKGKKGHGRAGSDGADAPAPAPAPERVETKKVQAPQVSKARAANGFASLDTPIDAGSHPDDSEWGA